MEQVTCGVQFSSVQYILLKKETEKQTKAIVDWRKSKSLKSKRISNEIKCGKKVTETKYHTRQPRYQPAEQTLSRNAAGARAATARSASVRMRPVKVGGAWWKNGSGSGRY